jgi:hypothetical protein
MVVCCRASGSATATTTVARRHAVDLRGQHQLRLLLHRFEPQGLGDLDRILCKQCGGALLVVVRAFISDISVARQILDSLAKHARAFGALNASAMDQRS